MAVWNFGNLAEKSCCRRHQKPLTLFQTGLSFYFIQACPLHLPEHKSLLPHSERSG
jgi:hypothetical protein